MSQKIKQKELFKYYFFDEILNNKSHTLVAGITGSGKSVILNGLIYNATFNGEHLILIDPKIVEFNSYKKLCNLIAYGNEYNSIKTALNTAVNIMYKRLDYMVKHNQRFYSGTKITIIIDEYTDLITTYKKEFEPLLIKLLALSRATNMQVIIATQAPNRRTITSNIKLNIGQFVGLHCASAIESKQIIDNDLLTTLPKYGQCILKTADEMQCYIVPMYTEEQIQELVNTAKRKFSLKSLLFR